MKNATEYESLIRKAYGCGRYVVVGADADIYRKYEQIITQYDDLSDSGIAYSAGVEMGKIIAYIDDAIFQVLIYWEKTITEEHQKELEACRVKLNDNSRDAVDYVLEKAHIIFSKMGIY